MRVVGMIVEGTNSLVVTIAPVWPRTSFEVEVQAMRVVGTVDEGTVSIVVASLTSDIV
jgi:hypothetical protein